MDCVKHEDYLKSHFEFIEFVIDTNKRELELSAEHLSTLWELFVTKATCVEESNFLFLHFMKSDEEGRRYEILFDNNAPR